MTVNARVNMRVEATQVAVAKQATPLVAASLVLASGTGVGEADRVYADSRTVASAANDDIDLRGVLLDAFGAVLNIAEVVVIGIVNANADGVANTTALTVGGGSNPFAGIFGTAGDQVVIPPGGMFLIACDGANGLGAAAAGTADILRVANGAGAPATYQIVIIGRSA
jgi:hypothetical protein